MGHLKRFLRRLINVMRPGREEAELEREIVSHLVLLEDEHRPRQPLRPARSGWH